MSKLLRLGLTIVLFSLSFGYEAAAEPTGGWSERTIFEKEFTHVTERHRPILSVRGGPRDHTGEMYDIEITISDTVTRKVSIRTFGIFTEEVEADVVDLPPSTNTVRLRVFSRYDASRPSVCVADTPAGCVLRVPTDPNWVSEPDAEKAAFVVSVVALRDQRVVFERSVEIPYVGQLTQ
jgi:hypothetical protein